MRSRLEADRLLLACDLPLGGEEVLVRVPRRFVDDHMDRDLPCGWIVRANKTKYVLSCTPVELSELLEDARHYASPEVAKELGKPYLGLVTSARACVKAIEG